MSRWFLIVSVLVLGGMGCQAARPAEVTVPTLEETVWPDEISVEDVARLNEKGEILVIDVREESEYAQGHIPGAQLIPLGTLTDHLDKVPTDQRVILVCRSGARSYRALQLLRGEGYVQIQTMRGGMIAWQNAGLPEE